MVAVVVMVQGSNAPHCNRVLIVAQLSVRSTAAAMQDAAPGSLRAARFPPLSFSSACGSIVLKCQKVIQACVIPQGIPVERALPAVLGDVSWPQPNVHGGFLRAGLCDQVGWSRTWRQTDTFSWTECVLRDGADPLQLYTVNE